MFATTRAELGFGRAERDASIVLLTVTLVLIASRYGGSGSQSQWLVSLLDAFGFDWLGDRLDHAMHVSVHRSFNRRAYFALFRMAVYIVPAYVVGRWILGLRMSELGWRIGWGWKKTRLYVGFYAFMLPIVLLVSTTPAFQDKYPFYVPNDFESLWPWFFAWEALYFGQFLALELFLRGFGVIGLSRHFGVMAAVILTVPYVSMHFGKPVLESIGSIFAGLALGIVAIRKGSVFWGGVLHWSVAVTMDILAY